MAPSDTDVEATTDEIDAMSRRNGDALNVPDTYDGQHAATTDSEEQQIRAALSKFGLQWKSDFVERSESLRVSTKHKREWFQSERSKSYSMDLDQSTLQ
jgi:hypothetical protein